MNPIPKELTRYLLCVALLPLISGCLLELLSSTAIVGELEAQGAQSAMKQLQQARKTSETIQIQQAVDVYAAEHGVYPASLEMLVPAYLAEVPLRPDGTPVYFYDPATGRFSDTPFSSTASTVPTMTQLDQKNLDAIYDALDNYYAMRQENPKSLNDLAPFYMEKVPTVVATGKPYIYDAQTGQAYHPFELAAPAQLAPVVSTDIARPRSNMGGGSPLAESLTGIGIQNELNQMHHPNSGPTRHQVQNMTDQHSQRQMEALEELGL